MLPYIINKIEDLPTEDQELAKRHYTPKDGVLVLDLKDDMDKRVQGLTTNSNQLKTEKLQLKDQLAKFEGIDPLEYKKTQEELKSLKDKGSSPSREEIISQVRTELQKQYDEKLVAGVERANRIEQLHKSVLLQQEITEAFLKHGVLPDAIGVATPFVASRAEVVEHEGKFKSRIKGNNGSFEVSVQQGGDGFKTVDELVGELKVQPTLAFLFEGSKADGTGGNNKKSSDADDVKGTINLESIKSKAEMRGNISIQSAFIEKFGSDAYLLLPDK